MLSPRSKEIAHLEALLDAALVVSAFALAFAARTALPSLGPLGAAKPELLEHAWIPCLAVPLFWVFASQSGLYAPYRAKSWARVAWIVVRPTAWLGLILGAAVFVTKSPSVSRAVLLLFVVFTGILVVASRLLLKATTLRGSRLPRSTRNVLVVGVDEAATDVRRKLEAHAENGMRVVGHLAASESDLLRVTPSLRLGLLDDLARIVEEKVVDDVVFAVPPADLAACERHVAWCEEVGVTVHLRVDFIRTLIARTHPTMLEGTPMLTLASTPRDPVALAVKRVLDFAATFAALVVLSPLLLACVLLVRLTSRGPALFRQERVGLNGRAFTLYKFRTMVADAEAQRARLEASNEADGAVFKMRHDPRITAVGAWLRRFSLDELPQLWNVLRGDMSLVGPRPPLAEEVRRYERWQRRRLSMKPGITCIWQVSGRSSIGFEEWMRLDLFYIDNWSLKLDCLILLRTLPAVAFARGAY